ncbi:hypothetical protein CLAIMM_11146 [Cladophialophora immunda]|nr:hypothetical protein CLAIMM_11146 [Cladophialophora immunda]
MIPLVPAVVVGTTPEPLPNMVHWLTCCRPEHPTELRELQMELAELRIVPETPCTVMPPPRPPIVTPLAPASDVKQAVEADWQLVYALEHKSALGKEVGA